MNANNSISIVEAIIFNEKKEVLLLRRSEKNTFFKGFWQLAGGKVEVGENIDEAIKREVFEETGCSCIDLHFKKTFSFKEKFNGFNGVLFLSVFMCSVNEKIKLSDDHVEFGFFSVDKIKDMNLTTTSRKAIFD